MDSLKEPIDYVKLEEELQKSLEADELYKLQNDAKFRAIEQKVPTYDCFREMVNAAHLKPLDPRTDKVITRKKGINLWNPLSSTIPQEDFHPHRNPSKKSRETVDGKLGYSTIPKTAEGFLKIWKGIDNPEERIKYLWNLRKILPTRIFQCEIPVDFLTEFIGDAILETAQIYPVEEVIEILFCLSRCNRFLLNLTFMTRPEKDRLARLFEKLLQLGITKRQEIVELSKIYEEEEERKQERPGPGTKYRDNAIPF